MTKNLGVKLLGGAAIAGLLIGCPTSPDGGPCEGAQCVGSFEGGLDGPDGPLADGDVPDVDVPGCDLTKAPKDSPACLDDKAGIFVSPTGSDNAAGTRATPVKTIPKAVALAGAQRLPRVYVCEGTYPEPITVTGPVSLYGGLTCARVPAEVTPLLAPPKGVALRITSVAAPIVVQDLAITGSADTAAPGDSAIAVFVVGSPAVTLRHVALRAGPGVAGKGEAKAADGALLASTPTAGTLNGNGGGPTNGGLAQTCTCVGGSTSKGGGGGSTGADGSPGETAQATPEPTVATGAGQTANDCLMAGPVAKPGSAAPAGGAGAGATTLGTLTAAGWAPQPGADATAYGSPGQGGGGGGGAGGGGGGGACGGCGGAPGKAGGGGGASLALLALDSPVALLASSLTTADAGNAAPGGQGGDGLAGGTRGPGGGAACNGGNGGKGGAGGAGGGGSGGISAGVLAKGKPPTLDPATTAATLPGKKGDAGGGNGIDGQSAPLVTLP